MQKNLEWNQESKGVQLEEETIGFGDCFTMDPCSILFQVADAHVDAP